LVAVDPSLGLSAPKGSGRLPRVLRDDELHVLLDQAPAEVEGEPAAVRRRDDAVLELLYGSGLRVGELCGLRPEDLDLDRRVVRVWGRAPSSVNCPWASRPWLALRAWYPAGRAQLATQESPTTRCS